MADVSIQQLRSALVHAQGDLRLAEKRLADAGREHRQHVAGACPVACARELQVAEEEREAAEQRLASARAELENFEEDERDGNLDTEPSEPQGDYKFWEIVAKLHHFRQRATYRAVGELRGADAGRVRAWIPVPAPDNCFVVQGSTGEPTRYPPSALHPELKKHARVLRTGKELLEWFQLPAHRLVIR